jgi:hypothetical protein
VPVAAAGHLDLEVAVEQADVPVPLQRVGLVLHAGADERVEDVARVVVLVPDEEAEARFADGVHERVEEAEEVGEVARSVPERAQDEQVQLVRGDAIRRRVRRDGDAAWFWAGAVAVAGEGVAGE